ncbi:hypothetical protein GCM10025867_02340 [Frondihabitans sucicola]|uniref:DUF4303 domain-containing protein n=1 Tax=Frondihabitans sucicola TaxID=1268041 RepID=A0ABM8GI20_9MICO|nr:DUF4303 domain-containing protein [Frondihabitans sucicola]BDZ47993.1 hypothetical protein GCM10025867_02340 [Frondihabitans sucicola]
MRLSRDQLATSIADAARSTWRELCADRPGVPFAGFALYSDESAMTLLCSANTPENLTRLDEDDPEVADAVRWTPAEWDLEDIGSWFFDGVNEVLLEAFQAEEPLEERAAMFDAAVDALERLRDEGEFQDHPDLVVMFRLSDDEHDERDSEWLARLNPADIVADYEEWLEG